MLSGCLWLPMGKMRRLLWRIDPEVENRCSDRTVFNGAIFGVRRGKIAF